MGGEDSELPPFFGVVIARREDVEGYREGGKKKTTKNDPERSRFGLWSLLAENAYPFSRRSSPRYIVARRGVVDFAGPNAIEKRSFYGKRQDASFAITHAG